MTTARSGGVIIVGAGPTGLVLASELALAGVPATVLERRGEPRADSRAICLHARSLEALDLRGLAGRFTSAGLAVPAFPLGPRGAAIRFSMLDSDFPYLLDIWQSEIERLLLERLAELGAGVRWSASVTQLAQDDDGVTVTLADGSAERASYVIGCDGVRSSVRNAMAIPFPGSRNPGSVILADLRLSGLPMDAAYGDLSRRGMLLVFPFRDGSCRIVLYDYDRADVPVTEPVSLAEIRDGLRRVAGQDFGPADLAWSGRYRSESRQVPAYRAGRVLLAGDAAHAHSPAGAQGMNTGIQDAVNLGWKLGAVLGGWAPDWLLDSYHAERHPVGAAVLALTGRQFRLNTARTARGRALRWAVHRAVVPLPPVQARLASDYSGLSIRYPPAEAGCHPLCGARLPRAVTADGRRVAELFHDGAFVLLERDGAGLSATGPPATGPPATESPATESPAAGPPPAGLPAPGPLPGGSGRLVVAAHAAAGLPATVLARPDGYVAWASDAPDPAGRDAALRRWGLRGQPAQPAQPGQPGQPAQPG